MEGKKEESPSAEALGRVDQKFKPTDVNFQLSKR